MTRRVSLDDQRTLFDRSGGQSKMKIVRFSYLLLLGAASCFAQSKTPVINFAETTGMVGIADGETARFNVMNPGAVAPAVGVVCTAALAFVNTNGVTVKLLTVTVTPGRSASFDLTSDTD